AVSVPLSKRSVYLPTSPLIASPLNVAAPLPVVVAAAFVSVAPVGPVAITAVTVVPAWLTALPFASRSCRTGGEVNATPLCAVAGGGVLIVSCAAAPAVPVAVNVTGLPESDPDVAINVFWPAVGPRVQLPTVAIPFPSVVCAAPVILPLAVPTTNVTDTPETGLPNASVTITDGGTGRVLPAGACCPLPPLGPIVAAAAGFTLTAAVSVTGTEPFTMAVTVFVPAAVELNEPVICPPALVVPTGWVSVLPVAGVTKSVTVAPLTGLPLASRTVTVMVLEPAPAVIVAGAAATVDCVALGPPAVAV